MKRWIRSRCQICKYANEERDFGDRNKNKDYCINYDFDCDSTNIVHLVIECEKCVQQYIGITITAFVKTF